MTKSLYVRLMIVCVAMTWQHPISSTIAICEALVIMLELYVYLLYLNQWLRIDRMSVCFFDIIGRN